MKKTFTELGFKDGDVVVCLRSEMQSSVGYRAGDEFKLKQQFDGQLVTDCGSNFNGYLGDWELKEKDMTEFKVGDKVKVTKRSGYFGVHSLVVGDIYEISSKHSENGFRLKATGSGKNTDKNYVHKGEIELYTEDMFEDEWHLNDGKVEIPDDADKLEKNGSVVAFRKRKVKPFEFGEKLRIKKSLWSPSIIDSTKANPGFDYVNAVYLSKYFNSEGKEGIQVYIDNGEKGWECCFTDLSKVERMT